MRKGEQGPAPRLGLRTTSYGLVLLASPGLIFLAHATGAQHWDLPKGGANPGETPLEAVLRETREETGLNLNPAALRELGRFRYRQDKALHLFAMRVEQGAVRPDDCFCHSFFAHPVSGQPTPEADAFEWVPFSQVSQRCAKNMTKVLLQTLVLEDLLETVPCLSADRAFGGSVGGPQPPSVA